MTASAKGILSVLALVLWGATGVYGAFDAKTASTRDLFVRIQRYGETPQLLAEKKLAQAEFRARGGEAIRFLMEHVHIRNMWVRFVLTDYVEHKKIPAEQVVPVLLEFLDDEHPKTRKRAAYCLGFYDTPEHAALVLPLLEDEEAQGAAARTLGKWHAKEAIPRIMALATHTEERRRVVAMNALRDIGDPRALPTLIHALSDPYCTVRKTASRALATFGNEAGRAVLNELDTAKAPALREMVAVLGTVKYRKAVRRLRRLLDTPDPGLRSEAARALIAIDADAAEDWVEGTPAEGMVSVTPDGVSVNLKEWSE